MEKIKVLKANKEHKEFIIHANNVINNVNDTEQTKDILYLLQELMKFISIIQKKKEKLVENKVQYKLIMIK